MQTEHARGLYKMPQKRWMMDIKYFISYVIKGEGVDYSGNADITANGPITGPSIIRAIEDAIQAKLEGPAAAGQVVVMGWKRFEHNYSVQGMDEPLKINVN